MADKKSKTVDAYKVEINPRDLVGFEQFITETKILNFRTQRSGNYYSIKLLDHKPEKYVICLFQITKTDDAPPKTDVRTGEHSPLGFKTDEGLSYGQVFYYDVKSEVIYLERATHNNKVLTWFLEKANNSNNCVFGKLSITLGIVLKSDAINRALASKSKKSISVRIANPKTILTNFELKNNSLLSILNNSIRINSNIATLEYKVKSNIKHPESLNNDESNSIIEEVGKVINSVLGNYISKAEILIDGNSRSERIINIIGDRITGEFELKTSLNKSDLNEEERKIGILKAFNEMKSKVEGCI